VGRIILAIRCLCGLLFAGLSLLGRYSPAMPYHRGVPEITWWSLGTTGFLLLVLFLLGLRKK
jgi:ubiquinone biosynthesis protein